MVSRLPAECHHTSFFDAPIAVPIYLRQDQSVTLLMLKIELTAAEKSGKIKGI